MSMFVRLRSDKADAAGVELTGDGYSWLSSGWLDGVLGSVDQQAILASSIDQAPVKVGQREGARVFPVRVDIEGASWAAYVALRDALVDEIRDCNEYGGRLRVRASSASAAVEFVVQHIGVGPLHSQMAETSNRHHLELHFTCSPYAYGDPMDVADDFANDSLGTGGVYNDGGADWAVRSGTTPTILGHRMTFFPGTTAAVVEHTATPYSIGDNQQAIKFEFTAQVSGNAAGVILKRLADGSHLRVIVDDNGVNSTLRIQKVTSGGVATNLGAPVNLASRVPANTPRWIRGRCEGNVVIAEYWTTVPYTTALASGATSTYAHTLTGSDATLYGVDAVGATGVYAAPTATSYVYVWDWARACFVYNGSTSAGRGGTTSVTQIESTGAIPGTTSAEVAVRFEEAAPVPNALSVAWMARASTTVNRLFGWIKATAALVSGETMSADALSVDGSIALCGAGSMTMTFPYVPDLLKATDSSRVVMVRAVARVRIASTATTATIKAEITGGQTATPLEFGSTARNLIGWKPTAGTKYRLVNLGTLPVIASPAPVSGSSISVTATITVTAGTANTVGLDGVMFFAADRSAHTPHGVASGDLSYLMATAGSPYEANHALRGASVLLQATTALREYRMTAPSLVGSRVLVPDGERIEWLVVPSTLPVDVSNGTTTNDQAFGGGARMLQFSVQPRYWIGG